MTSRRFLFITSNWKKLLRKSQYKHQQFKLLTLKIKTVPLQETTSKPSNFPALQNVTHCLWCDVNIDILRLTLTGYQNLSIAKYHSSRLTSWLHDIRTLASAKMIWKCLSKSGPANLGGSAFLSKPLAQPHSVAHAEAYVPNSAPNLLTVPSMNGQFGVQEPHQSIS